MELADTQDLESCAARRAGSNPAFGRCDKIKVSKVQTEALIFYSKQKWGLFGDFRTVNYPKKLANTIIFPLRRSLENLANIQVSDNLKSNHSIFCIQKNRPFIIFELSVFYLDYLDDISLDESTF